MASRHFGPSAPSHFTCDLPSVSGLTHALFGSRLLVCCCVSLFARGKLIMPPCSERSCTMSGTCRISSPICTVGFGVTSFLQQHCDHKLQQSSLVHTRK